MSNRDIKLRVWMDSVTTIMSQMDHAFMYSNLVKKHSKPLLSESDTLQLLESFYQQIKRITADESLDAAIDKLTSDNHVDLLRQDSETPHNGYCKGMRYECNRCQSEKFV